ncbi:MAG: hypothetical protein KatS3mg043_1308 [Rhodothermaceae bacterium]|nr:MAG: hypothetical protein KatS3mg043_1308 [Rhodothermaceae bacterium]
MDQDIVLIERFKREPEAAYAELLERYTPFILRMIRRFLRDPDEMMEVYTTVCERFRANDFQALRQFRVESDLLSWISVVVANACRDRLRKHRAVSIPEAVLSRLDEREQLVFKYYYQQGLTHEEIAHLVAGHGVPCTAHDVLAAIERIDDLLTVSKRWYLLAALQMNRASLSLEALGETGYQPEAPGAVEALEAALDDRELIIELNAALSRLDPEDQLLVLLRYEHGMTGRQIAQLMQYDKTKHVYTRLRTILARLRREIGVDG